MVSRFEVEISACTLDHMIDDRARRRFSDKHRLGSRACYIYFLAVACDERPMAHQMMRRSQSTPPRRLATRLKHSDFPSCRWPPIFSHDEHSPHGGCNYQRTCERSIIAYALQIEDTRSLGLGHLLHQEPSENGCL